MAHRESDWNEDEGRCRRNNVCGQLINLLNKVAEVRRRSGWKVISGFAFVAGATAGTVLGMYFCRNKACIFDATRITDQPNDGMMRHVLVEKGQRNLEYKLNKDTLKFIGKLYEYRFNHHEDQDAAKRFKNGQWFCGNLLQRNQEMDVWATASHHNNIVNPEPVICEIGFAWGFSALVILAEHPSAKYVGFDIGAGYSKDAFEILNASYPDRFQMIWGDSSTSILEMAGDSSNTIRCDIWIIDGDHSYAGAKKDLDAILDNVPQLSNPNSLVLWDDCDPGDASGHVDDGVIEREWPTEGNNEDASAAKGPTKVFTEAVKEGRLKYIKHGAEKDSKGRFVGWCVSQIADKSDA